MHAESPRSLAPLATSVIVPAYNAAGTLRKCLAALAAGTGRVAEVIVVDDGSTDATAAVAAEMGVRVLRLARTSGPAAARNHGARHARGDVLLFVDADVVLAPDALARAARTLAAEPDVAAVFGSYDARPDAPGLVSQYRNLLHHWVHQHGNPEAFTFWAGCGAIRRAVFEAVGGFDERRVEPAIEDIELGHRVRAAGYRIRLDRAMQCMHLKRWTIGSMIRTDLWRRAVPWARLLLESGTAPADLNLARGQRASVVLTGIAALGLVLSAWGPALVAGAGALAAVLLINRSWYGFLWRQRGAGFAIASIPLHLLYFACGGLGFAWAWLEVRLRARRGAERGALT